MSNPWIKHVKKVQRENNLTYGEALHFAAKSYRKKPKRKAMKGKGVVDETKKFYKKHKSTIHKAGKIVGGIGLAGLALAAGNQSLLNHRRRKNYVGQVFEQIDASDPYGTTWNALSY